MRERGFRVEVEEGKVGEREENEGRSRNYDGG